MNFYGTYFTINNNDLLMFSSNNIEHANTQYQVVKTLFQNGLLPKNILSIKFKKIDKTT